MSSRKHIVIDARIRRASSGRPLDRLVEHLQDIDTYHRYTVLVQQDDTWKMRSPNFHTLPCPFPQFSFNPLHELRFAWLLYRLKPDLVHFGMTQQPLLYFGNIVTMTHDLTMFNFVRRGTTPMLIYRLKIGLYRFQMRWAHMKSRRITVPTKRIAQEVSEFQPTVKDRIIVTYEASEPPLKIAAVRPERVNAHDQFIMYVGTAFPHKNLEKLVEAFDLLHDRRPGLKLVLVGKKEKHYEELEQKAQTHPSAENIIFTGFVPDESLKWLFTHCQAYVFASLSEGFGLPPLEAMQHGAPVVSSNASCIPEVCGDAAYYFNPHSAKDMADKIGEVLDDKELRKGLVEKSRQQVKKYSWHKMAEETLVIYKELLDETIDA
jgi:glycosyltransferase involved in cell wall biosynthesis